MMKQPYVPVWNVHAYVCFSDNDSKTLLEAAAAASKSSNIVLVLKYDKEIGKKLGSAYLNAMLRFNDKINKYRKKSLEMLMFIYSDKEIGRNAGSIIIDRKEFVLFSDSKDALDAFAKKNQIKKLKEIKVLPGFMPKIT